VKDLGLSDLLAQSAIMRLIHLYPRGLDRLDRDILLSIGHAEATVEFTGMFDGTWAQFVDWLMGAHTNMLYNRHTIGNVLIQVDGARAVSETTATANLLVRRGDGDIEERLVHSRYLDRWRLDDGRWSLARRLTLRDRRSVKILTADELARTTEYVHAADVGRADPSYAHFA
jgi:hypothetical protein